MATLYIRNVDNAAIAKLDEIAKRRKTSRSQLMRDMLNKYTILDIENELDNKYAQLVTLATEAISINNKNLKELKDMIMEMKNE